jgi:ABC-type sugar transport system substrate-binding protein
VLKNLVGEQPGDENPVPAGPVVENPLTAHPDVSAIISYNKNTATAVLDSFKARGLTGKIFTAGMMLPQRCRTASRKTPARWERFPLTRRS